MGRPTNRVGRAGPRLVRQELRLGDLAALEQVEAAVVLALEAFQRFKGLLALDLVAPRGLLQTLDAFPERVGPSGPNRDYLLNLATWLSQVGEEDAHVAALVDRIS